MANTIEINQKRVCVDEVVSVLGNMLVEPRENCDEDCYELDLEWLPFDTTILKFGQNGSGVWWELCDGLSGDSELGGLMMLPTEQLTAFFLGPLEDDDFGCIDDFWIEEESNKVILNQKGVKVVFEVDS